MKITLCGLLLSLIAFGCAGQPFIAGSIDGLTLDIDSGRPISGAIVVARWKVTVFGIGQSQSVCVHAESAVSDADGRYHFNVWTEPGIASGVRPVLDVYKQGYKSVAAPLQYFGRRDSQGGATTWIVFDERRPNDVLQTFPDEQRAFDATHPTNQYLAPFTGSPDDRFEYLNSRVFSGMGCSGADASRRGLYPLYRAAIQEAKPLARKPSQMETLRMMRLNAASAWLGPGQGPGIPKAIPDEIKGDLE